MRVKIRFAAGTGQTKGYNELEVEAFPDLMLTLKHIEQETGILIINRLGHNYSLLINGRNYSSYVKEQVPLKDGDKLLFVPILGGG